MKLPEQAEALISQWTKGLTPVTRLRPNPDTVIDISKNPAGAYHVTTVFKLGDTWAVSADAQGDSADEAFRALARRVN